MRARCRRRGRVGDVQRRPEALGRLGEGSPASVSCVAERLDQWSGDSSGCTRSSVRGSRVLGRCRGGSTRSSRQLVGLRSDVLAEPSGPAERHRSRVTVDDASTMRRSSSRPSSPSRSRSACSATWAGAGHADRPRRCAGSSRPARYEVGEAQAVGGRHATVHDPCGRHTRLAAKAMAAQVRALPGALAVVVGERAHQRAAAECAAGVALAVRADQQDRIGQRRAEFLERRAPPLLASRSRAMRTVRTAIAAASVSTRIARRIRRRPDRPRVAGRGAGAGRSLGGRGRVGAKRSSTASCPQAPIGPRAAASAALVDGADHRLIQLARPAPSSAWAASVIRPGPGSRRCAPGRRRTGRNRGARRWPTPRRGTRPIRPAEDAADQRADRDRAPHDEAHRGVHPALHALGRDRLAQPDLVDVVDHDAEPRMSPPMTRTRTGSSAGASGPRRSRAPRPPR